MSEIVVSSDDLVAPLEVQEDRVKHTFKEADPRISIKKAEKGKIRLRKVGEIFTHPFRCINKFHSNSTTPNSSSSSSSSNFASGISFGSSAKYPYFYGEQPIGRCYFCCVSPPPVVEEDAVHGMPNVASYEHVKNLIENNNFYSVDCNVHRIPPNE